LAGHDVPRISFETVRRFCRICRLPAFARIHIQRFTLRAGIHVPQGGMRQTCQPFSNPVAGTEMRVAGVIALAVAIAYRSPSAILYCHSDR